MRLGQIQRDIVDYLTRCGADGGYIGPLTKDDEFRGYDFEQVERSLAALMRRGVIRREGIRYVLSRR